MDRARAGWTTPPDWIAALAAECDKTSQGRTAQRLGISSAAVNQVLGASYKGRLDRVEARVRGELMRETVACPVLGELSRRDCLDHQGRKFSAANPTRVKLYRACKDCPNREKGDT
jgi:hypothetical protein